MKKLTVDDVIEWVILNRHDTEAIDELNKATFPFTSKYRHYSTNRNDNG